MTRLSGIEAVADRLRGQLAAADASLSERDSTVQLLTADKAYLSKEVQVMRTAASHSLVSLQDETPQLPACLAGRGSTHSMHKPPKVHTRPCMRQPPQHLLGHACGVAADMHIVSDKDKRPLRRLCDPIPRVCLRCCQVTEARMADLTNRLAVAEEKVTALKGERSRLYQQLAESSSASRTRASAGQ